MNTYHVTIQEMVERQFDVDAADESDAEIEALEQAENTRAPDACTPTVIDVELLTADETRTVEERTP